eukprot:934157-Amorphochlora_amoeboformis.AAC.1
MEVSCKPILFPKNIFRQLTYRCGKTLLYARATMDEPSFYFFNESDYTLLGGTGQFSYCMVQFIAHLHVPRKDRGSRPVPQELPGRQFPLHHGYPNNFGFPKGLPVISLFVHYPMDVAHE